MSNGDVPVFPVLLAGGSGTRLWPVSRELFPKQLAKLIGGESLIQSTIRRVVPPLPAANLRVVCGEAHRHEIARHMDDIGTPSAGKVIVEPVGRNTAPAILLACLELRRLAGDAVLAVFPADHVIGDLAAFHERLAAAVGLAADGNIVTFGITPRYPETGYGYVEGGAGAPRSALAIRRFVEKPDLTTAQAYVASGNFYWNSGMFAFRVSVMLEEFAAHHPAMLAALESVFRPGEPVAREDYLKLPDLSIDCAIMEKTSCGVVLPSDFGWSDIGSWNSLYDFLAKDGDGNVLDGDVIVRDTKNCFVLGYERLIAVNCLRDLVVVETPDSIFVSDMEHSRDVKSIVAELKQRGRQESREHLTRHFPWGTETLLETAERHRASRMALDPGGTASFSPPAGVEVQLIGIVGAGEVQSGPVRRRLSAGESLQLQGGREVAVRGDDGVRWELMRVEIRIG
ncbi:MAG TPA: mannose-1-phosphate guanylyltransferase/mannose-6-phosphate isomerase [Desulfobacterales bacterium]|nr:mannose-1-phosphate guanylyltransferase/mannose-6-phosphate isomerase [Desulfobacterales bacterium]